MSEGKSRREFLKTASLAGVAAVTGTGAMAARTALAGTTTTPSVRVDAEGYLVIDYTDENKALIAKLYEIWKLQEAKDKPDAGPRKGIKVTFNTGEPGTDSGHQVNSLCTC